MNKKPKTQVSIETNKAVGSSLTQKIDGREAYVVKRNNVLSYCDGCENSKPMVGCSVFGNNKPTLCYAFKFKA